MRKTIKRNLFVTLLVCAFICFGLLALNIFSAPTAYATTGDFTVTQGAEVRAVNDDKGNGLRFEANIKKSYYDGLDYSGKVAGMFIVPTDYVNSAGGSTFNALTTYLDGKGVNILSKDFDSFADNGDYYSYKLSLVNILDANYARAMTAVAYIKIPQASASTAPEGAILYGDNYYIYAENTFSRSIYEVAKLAWQNNERPTVVKEYLDGVVDITANASDVSLTTIAEYTSPYTLEQDENLDYRVNNSGNPAKTVMVNGEIIKNVNTKLNDKNLYLFKKDKGTVTGNDVTMNTGGLYNYSEYAHYADSDYVAFEGKYDVGTYVSVSFKGNNLPHVMFFADEINGAVGGSSATAKGVLYCSGLYDTYMGGYIDGTIHGPNRMQTSAAASFDPNWFNSILMKNLANDPDASYTVVVGTEWNSEDKLVIKEYVYTRSGSLLMPAKDTQGKVMPTPSTYTTNITKGSVDAGNIILFAPIKGEGTSTFSFSAPTQGFVEPENVLDIASYASTINSNGSLTLMSSQIVAEEGNIAPYGQYTRHFTIKGDYGVGTYIDLEFTGKNMPQMMLFGRSAGTQDANYQSNENYANISNSGTGNGEALTNAGRKGVVILNKTMTSNDKLMIYGPDRIPNNANISNGAGAIACIAKEDYPELTFAGLVDGKAYKYTVGSFEKAGTVYLHFILKNGSDDSVIYDRALNLGLTVEQVGVGNITLYAPFTDNGTPDVATATIDKFSALYTLEAPTSFAEFEKQYAAIRAVGGISNASDTYYDCYDYATAATNNNEYVALKGQSVVGKTLEIEFGASVEYIGGTLTDFGHLNLPDIILFADNINGIKGKAGGKGIFITAGVGSWGEGAAYYNQYRSFGMYRYGDNGLEGGTARGGKTDIAIKTSYPLLCASGLKADSNGFVNGVSPAVSKTYKFTITTSYNNEDKLVITVSLAIKEGDSWNTTIGGVDYSNISATTVFSRTDIEGLGDNLLLLPADKQNVYQGTTKFKYSVK